MAQPTIVLTGGGTAGHVSVNEALIPVFTSRGYDVHYIGSYDGIEKDLIDGQYEGVTYHAISSGKLRRYFSLKNFTDPFRVLNGIGQAYRLLRKLKPSIVFSKGGFVSVPVVMAAKLAKIPVVVHESDMTPGLANKLSLPFAAHIFTVFESTLQHVPEGKGTAVGAIVRPELFEGEREKGLYYANLKGDKKVLLAMGGSQGSLVLNEAIRSNLDQMLQNYDIIHLCGKGHIDEALEGVEGYTQFEYVTTALPDLLAATDVAVSRAGSNTIFELLALEKPMVLVPLSAAKSRGDQILNAKRFEELHLAKVIQEEELNEQTLSEALQSVAREEEKMKRELAKHSHVKTPETMTDDILSYRK